MKRLILLCVVFILINYSNESFAQGQFWGAFGYDNGLGSIFKFNADGTGFSVEKNVPIEPENPGYYPTGKLVQASNGKIYGITGNGGANNKGVLFEFDPITNTYVKKIDFSGP